MVYAIVRALQELLPIPLPTCAQIVIPSVLVVKVRLNVQPAPQEPSLVKAYVSLYALMDSMEMP